MEEMVVSASEREWRGKSWMSEALGEEMRKSAWGCGWRKVRSGKLKWKREKLDFGWISLKFKKLNAMKKIC